MQGLVLVTGFGSFEDVDDNPSGRLARALGLRVDALGIELPVSFERAPALIDGSLALLAAPPVALFSMGVHPGATFRLEATARAALSSTRPDNDGALGAELALEGPELTTSLDLDALDAALIAAGGAPTERSSDAGGYVCERVYRHVLEHAQRLGVPGFFLHVPPLARRPLEEQLPVATAALEELLRQVG